MRSAPRSDSGPWKVGASGAYYANFPAMGYLAQFANPDDDAWVVTAGGSYTYGNWAFGLQGVYSQWGEFSHATQETAWGVSLNTAYTWATGVVLEGQLAYTEAGYGDAGAITGRDIPPVHSWEVDFGTAITF